MQPTQPRHRRSQQQTYRPQYPDDAPRAQYPDYGQYPPTGTQNGGPQIPPQQQYVPLYQQQPQRTPYFQQSTVSYDSSYDDEPIQRRRHRPWLWLLILAVCAAVLVIGIFSVTSYYNAHYPAFRTRVNQLNTNTFMNGVHIDGVHIGGLTMDEAKRILQQTTIREDQQYALNVTIDGKTWRITQAELPLQRDLDAVLEEAYSIGRQGSLSAQQSGLTPFEYRSRTVSYYSENGAFLTTSVTYDKGTVRSLADTLAGLISTPAQDAVVASFDFNSRSFQFTNEQVGRGLKSDTIYNAIIQAMDGNWYKDGRSVVLQSDVLQPNVTRAMLQQSFGRISSYTTTTLAGYNRNKNIELACAAVTGTVVESGKTFSFNETVGRRTVDKGYLPAGAIAQGQSIEETGGGVCQVSSTMFNAAVMANMQIVASSAHAWPSAYVEPGRDATVDWQNFQNLNQSLDFKFKNTSDYPIFIVAYITGSNFRQACKCTVEFYGVALADGITIGMETQLVRTTPLPSSAPPEYAQADAEHPSGTWEIVRQGREGYVYETYRVFYQYGNIVRRELLRTSNYKAYSELIRYYSD